MFEEGGGRVTDCCLAGVFCKPEKMLPQNLTLLTGVPIAVRGNVKLRKMYQKILHLLDKVPRDASYRIATEATICHKMAILNESFDDIKEIEDNIYCGKIEQLLSQARDEYILLQKMLVWKPWEKLVERAPKGQWDWPPRSNERAPSVQR